MKNERPYFPLIVFWISGIIGVLLDLDHLPGLAQVGFDVERFFRGGSTIPGRPLHSYAVLVSGIVCIVIGALLLRLLHTGRNN